MKAQIGTPVSSRSPKPPYCTCTRYPLTTCDLNTAATPCRLDTVATTSTHRCLDTAAVNYDPHQRRLDPKAPASSRHGCHRHIDTAIPTPLAPHPTSTPPHQHRGSGTTEPPQAHGRHQRRRHPHPTRSDPTSTPPHRHSGTGTMRPPRKPAAAAGIPGPATLTMTTTGRRQRWQRTAVAENGGQ
ncbi:hypothetical protein EDB85DRAFT_1894195 [Lactarius pseudohatsudake]|nr:hypothetical protein EDB85DRAFT_1894195 [Lactarius pseudohatsudake]